MFRLVRLIIFVLIAFVAGLLFERSRAKDVCLDLGGDYTAGLCKVTVK